MPHEGDSGSKGEKKIGDLHLSICISKSQISFSSVTPKTSSRVTSSETGFYHKNIFKNHVAHESAWHERRQTGETWSSFVVSLRFTITLFREVLKKNLKMFWYKFDFFNWGSWISTETVEKKSGMVLEI